MRGRRNVHVLFKNHKILSVNGTIQKMVRYGRIDPTVLFLTSHHLLPRDPHDPLYEYSRGSGKKPRWNPLDGSIVQESTCYLNHRHASRQGDETVIWSLLCGTQVYDSAEAFWKARIGRVLYTDFLLASAPRLQNCPGSGWAPSRPTLQCLNPARGRTSSTTVYAATDGFGSEPGHITPHGLEAYWRVCEWSASKRKIPLKAWIMLNPDLMGMPMFRELALKYLCQFQRVALISAIHRDGFDTPAYHKADADGPLYALAASRDEKNWEWQRTYEWASSDNMPIFQREKILLV